MKNDEFERILLGAVSGRHEDLEALLRQYEPLIRKYSYMNGKLDEDLRQYILLHIALNIGKFPV